MRFRDMRGAREIKIDSHAICDSVYQRNAIYVLDLIEECMSGHFLDMAWQRMKTNTNSTQVASSSHQALLNCALAGSIIRQTSGMFQLRAQSIKSYWRWSAKSRILSLNGPSQTDVLRSTAHIPLLSME